MATAPEKMLVTPYTYVMADSRPVHGQRPSRWISEKSPNGRRLLTSEDGYKVCVVGVDVCMGPVKSPVFESELLADGRTKRGRCEGLEWAMRGEISRLEGAAHEVIWLSKAMRDLAPLLRRLHGLGYTVEELRRLVAGSLRVSVSADELAEVLFE